MWIRKREARQVHGWDHSDSAVTSEGAMTPRRSCGVTKAKALVRSRVSCNNVCTQLQQHLECLNVETGKIPGKGFSQVIYLSLFRSILPRLLARLAGKLAQTIECLGL